MLDNIIRLPKLIKQWRKLAVFIRELRELLVLSWSLVEFNDNRVRALFEP